MSILITGGTGFIGKKLIAKLNQCDVTILSRQKTDFPKQINCSMEDCLDKNIIFDPYDTVIHLAAIAHTNGFEQEKFISINTEATLKLATQAASKNVRRFIFLSSIGVNGLSNSKPFKYNDKPNPIEYYAISKYKAELGLKKIAENTGMEVVIIRPPLVYGSNAPGNFGTLLKVAKRNFPLPLGAINNQRSFIAIDNLVDLIVTCIDHPNAANEIFLVSDDENISTSNLLKNLTLAAGKKPWLIPVPVSFLKFIASIVGKKLAVERFSSSLTVDIEHTKATLNWKPPITLDEGIRRCFK